MRKRKFLALTLACFMGVGAMAGCGSDGSTQTGADGGAVAGTETGAADSGEVVTLKWIQVGNGMPSNYDAWLEQINPYLEEKNRGQRGYGDRAVGRLGQQTERDRKLGRGIRYYVYRSDTLQFRGGNRRIYGSYRASSDRSAGAVCDDPGGLLDRSVHRR